MNWAILQRLKDDSQNSLLKFSIDTGKIHSEVLHEMVLQILHDKMFSTQQLFGK